MNKEQIRELKGAFAAYQLAIAELMTRGPITEEDLRLIASQYGRNITNFEALNTVRHWFNLEQINKDLA